MAAGELTLLESGIWIIPLVLIGSLLGMYALILAWQGKTQRDLKTIHADLRAAQAQLRRFEQDTRHFSAQDREPYGSEMKALTMRLQDSHQRLAGLQLAYVQIQEAVHNLGLRQLQLLVGAPFYVFRWLSIRREVADLHQKLARISSEGDAYQQQVQVLSRRGWEVALHARQVLEKERQAQRALHTLAEQHVQGEAFETAVDREQRLGAALDQIPPLFFQAEEADLLAQADKDVIADVFALLAEVEPEVGEISEQVHGWEREVQETGARIGDLRRSLGEISDLMNTLPAQLQLDPYQERLKGLRTIADNLNATLARLEIESISRLNQEAGRVQVAAQEMGEALKRARRQLMALERILDELDRGLKDLSAQFAGLAKNPVHPVLWSQSRPRLTELSRQYAALGDGQKARLPEQVDKDLAAASALLAQQKDLARHCQRLADNHAELLKLYGNPELSSGEQMLIDLQALAVQAAVYAPENWPRGDSVATLTADLHSLAERHARLFSDDRANPLPEAEIGARLEAVRSLVEALRTLSARAGRVRTRLSELQDLEKRLRERFGAARSMLNQVELLARSNDFLNGMALSEIGGFRSQLESRGAELGQRRQGLVEEKARLLDALITQVETAANGWLERLNTDIEAKKKTLAEKLERLDEIAALDERAVVDAQRLLSQDLPTTVAQRSKQKTFFTQEELVAQLKPRSDTWQECVAALKGVEDLERPLVESYQEALQQYDLAREQLARAGSWLTGRRSWPPTSLSLEAELQEFKNTEAQWQAMVEQPNRAISVVRQLGDLSARFQKLVERAAQKVERSEAEQARIHDLELELEDLAGRWQALGQEYPEGLAEIRALTSQIGREVDSVKRQYRQGGQAYAEALQSLTNICQNVQNEQITLQDGRVIRLAEAGNRSYRRRL